LRVSAKGSRSEETRRKLVEAARAVLVEEGFGGASTRAIASRAGVNQALVFYHYDGVEPLLLAALDESSAARLAAYRAAVESSDSIGSLVAALGPVLADDEASGHMTLLTELVGASLSRPGLRAAMIDRAQPWRQLTEAAARRFLAGTPFEPAADDVASLVVALGLGLNMLARLDPDGAKLPGLAELGRALRGV
jgi:AcrR family transcriptional regulator